MKFHFDYRTFWFAPPVVVLRVSEQKLGMDKHGDGFDWTREYDARLIDVIKHRTCDSILNGEIPCDDRSYRLSVRKRWLRRPLIILQILDETGDWRDADHQDLLDAIEFPIA